MEGEGEQQGLRDGARGREGVARTERVRWLRDKRMQGSWARWRRLPRRFASQGAVRQQRLVRQGGGPPMRLWLPETRWHRLLLDTELWVEMQGGELAAWVQHWNKVCRQQQARVPKDAGGRQNVRGRAPRYRTWHSCMPAIR